jgi:hypothetical protein
VFGNNKSPFLKLFRHENIALEDIELLLSQQGLEGTLVRLYEAGIFVTYDEWRGLRPVKRGALEFLIKDSDTDNPLLSDAYEMHSSGSRGAGSRAFTDLALLSHESAFRLLALQSHGISDPRTAFWYPVPPNTIGINNLLRFARVGIEPLRWFSPAKFPGGLAGMRSGLLVNYTRLLCRLTGHKAPSPEYVPQEEVIKIASWLAGMVTAGTPAFFAAPASSAARICHEAAKCGLSLAGTVFEVSSEPLTEAKAAAIASAGSIAIDRYAASDFGLAGMSCATRAEVDDMHVVADRLHAWTTAKELDGVTVPALVYTTLATNSRKIMINAESGDYGNLVERDCGCAFGELGLRTHLSGLYGYDKVTSEGVTFMGTELYWLLEDTLPRRFGGDGMDYQLVEEEDESGIPSVSVVVAPRVGPLDEEDLIATVLHTLKGYDRYDRGTYMSDQWRQARTLRVQRCEPYFSGRRKILPLHILRKRTSV